MPFVPREDVLPPVVYAPPGIEQVLYYASHGLRVFPCAGKAPAIAAPRPHKRGCTGACGLWGHGVYDGTTDEDILRAMWANYPGANIGLCMGGGLLGIDIDARAGGLDTWSALEAQHGDLLPTWTNLTGSGGGSMHKIVRVPHGLKFPPSLGEGIQLKGEGGYLIVPPSLHPDTGRPYLWEADFAPEDLAPCEAPAWLLALPVAPAATNGQMPAPPGLREPGAPIKEGERNTRLFQIASAWRSKGLSQAGIYAELQRVNTEECLEPLDDDEVLAISENVVARYEPEATLVVTRASVPLGQPREYEQGGQSQSTNWKASQWYQYSVAPYEVNKKGKIAANNGTITAFLLNHPDWLGRFWWDEMASKIMLQTGDTSAELEEAEITRIGAHFCEHYYVDVGSDALMLRCVLAVAQQHRRDPLQAWLHALPGWDMQPRLETWLAQCTGARDDAYTRFCSTILPVSMIARAEEPGCICRTVVILQGPEEYRKSTFVSALVPFPQWYDELTGSLENKEAHLMVQGLWVAELGELDALSKTEETKLKSFISLRADSHIPKFKNLRVQPLRRTIFVGTTNEETYLKGQSGNTRYLPVTITMPIDVEQFLRLREQLYAEALVYYGNNPEQWWRMSSEAHRQAVQEREQRRQASWLEDDLHEWLTKRRFHNWNIRHTLQPMPEVEPVLDETTWRELATGYYQLASREKWKDVALQRQTAQAMRVLGWVPRIVKRHNLTQRIWAYLDEAKLQQNS